MVADPQREPPSASQQPQRPQKDRAIIAAVIGAAATISAAIIGVYAGQTNAGKDDTHATPPPAVTLSQTPFAVPSQPIAQSAAAGTPSPATIASPASASESSAEPAVWHRGRVTVTTGASADLDAPPTDGTWGFRGTAGDLVYEFGRMEAFGAAEWTRVSTNDPASCTTTTSYGEPSVATASLPGKLFCVATNGGRFALVKIVSASTHAVTFDAVTLKKEGD